MEPQRVTWNNNNSILEMAQMPDSCKKSFDRTSSPPCIHEQTLFHSNQAMSAEGEH